MSKANRFWAIVWPNGQAEVHYTWRVAEERTRGQTCKHRAFWDRRDCDGWIKQMQDKHVTFYRGPMPDLTRPTFRDQLISEQFQIAKDAGLI